MGTATLKSILERIIDQIINTAATVNNPAHKNGEEKVTLKKSDILAKSVTWPWLDPKVLFLKKKCTAVSSISLAISKSNILNVTFFLNMGDFIYKELACI